LAYKIRTKQYRLQNNNKNATPYIPQIYVKLKGWHPPPAPIDIENKLTTFEKLLKQTIHEKQKRTPNFTNLTITQRRTLEALKNNKEFIILPTDKNLGPAIMNRDNYIKQCLTEHLLTHNYKKLPNIIAMNMITSTKNTLKNIFNTHKHQLSQAEITYFTRSFKLHHRTPIFYGMPKVHKNPMALRPVVSCVNSFLSIFSNWLDFKMKDLLFLIPSYIKDSKDLLTEIKQLTLPRHAKLFTADASAMYTNIDTNIGITAFENLFHDYDSLIPKDFPKDLFLKVLKIVMENNIFKFGDTFWLQTQGTAMGTPAAPLYSILTFGYHENTSILNIFKPRLLYYKRFIDDIFGIWLHDDHEESLPKNQILSWSHFKQKLNTFGSLTWNVEPLTSSTTFLDLTITIKNNKLNTATYQKPLNLYLYIPPLSAHPSSCIKGLLTGELNRYWFQNSEEEDFIDVTTKFILRLVQRGHQIQHLIPSLQTAAANIDNINTKESPKNPNNDDTLYIHWRHHPFNIRKHQIREIYNKTLQGSDNFQDMRLAISRPKNLRDSLCKTELQNVTNNNVSDIFQQLTDNNTIN